MPPIELVRDEACADGPTHTERISAAMAALYAAFYAHGRTTAVTYINDKVVVCVLENILTETEDVLVAAGARGQVIDGRVAVQTETEDEFTAAIERLTHRHVVAFLSANQPLPASHVSCSSSTPQPVAPEIARGS